MEMVFDLRYRRLFALSWEKSVRGCVLLIFFGILYLYVRACPTMDEVKRGGIAVNRRVNEITGIESENVYDSREHIFMGFREQGTSLVATNPGEIKKSVKAAEAETPKIRTEQERAVEKPEPVNFVSNENIYPKENVDRRSELVMIENNVPEIITTPDFSDNSIEAAEPDTDIKEPEEETEVNDLIISDGFSVDAQGYITGITDSLVLLDEILIISADQRCVGIRENAFSDIEGFVTEIYIPANIHDIEAGAFRYFQDLMYIEVSENNPYYSSVEGILYSKSGEEILCPIGR